MVRSRQGSGARQAGPIRGAITVAVLGAIALAGLAPEVRAEPYMALREGRKCSTCHVNMTGGGMRTLLANAHLEDITHYRDLFPGLADVDAFDGQVTSFFSVGADLRLDDSIVFQDAPDAAGQVPNHKVFRSRVDENVLGLSEAALYFLLKPVPDLLEIYLDQTFAPGGATTREVFALMRGLLPWGGFLKGGQFYLDYGLRTANDDLFSQGGSGDEIFVRGRTGTSFTGYAQGAEIGIQPGPVFLSTSVTAASDATAPRVTGNAYSVLRGVPVLDNVLAGGSFMWTPSAKIDQTEFALYAGTSWGPFEVQGEIDFIRLSGDLDGLPADSTLLYGEVNYLLLDWINTKAFAEWADNDGLPNSPDSAQNRFGFGVEPFLGRYLQTLLYYSIANGPRNLPDANQNRLVLELHVFL